MSDYPEHDKLRAISDKSQAIGEFIDWLGDKGIHLADYPMVEVEPWPGRDRKPRMEKATHLHTIQTPITKLLAEFFEIDLRKIDAEKDAMLEAMRAMNA